MNFLIATMGPSTLLIIMDESILTANENQLVSLDLKPLSIPQRPQHLPPMFKSNGGAHPHRQHGPHGSCGNIYIYVQDTIVQGLENARYCAIQVMEHPISPRINYTALISMIT